MAAAGCGSGGGGSSGPPSVSMKGLRFHPDAVKVKVGQKVTWTNDDGNAIDHNVTATSGAKFHSQAFGPGKRYSFTPRTPGTISYVCTLHPGMKGKLIVTK